MGGQKGWNQALAFATAITPTPTPYNVLGAEAICVVCMTRMYEVCGQMALLVTVSDGSLVEEDLMVSESWQANRISWQSNLAWLVPTYPKMQVLLLPYILSAGNCNCPEIPTHTESEQMAPHASKLPPTMHLLAC